jgi:hypothetical protein
MSVRSVLVAWGAALLVAVTAAGCSSGGGQPPWAKALGSGVTVTPPGNTSPDNNSPADVVTGLVDAIKAGNYKGICQYYEPSQQSTCNSNVASASPAALASAFASFKTIKATYTVIDGDQALVGATGKVCDPSTGKCSTNNDPAAVLDSGKSFSALWKEASASSSDVYSPIPTIKINGKWYGYTSTS